jgi:HD superfamily phosphohydrolase YqeK
MHSLKSALKAFPPDFEPYILMLRAMLTPRRFLHCLEVGLAMGQAYRIYGRPYDEASADDWILAGLLHDIMKEAPQQTMLWWVAKYGHKAPLKSGTNAFYLHGPASAAFARYGLGLRQSASFFEAISQHTGNYGRMRLMARCLHVADMTVPVQRYPGCKKLARLFYQGRLDEAELLLNTWATDFFVKAGIPVDRTFHTKIRRLAKRVRPGPDFYSRDDPPYSSAPPPP